MNRLKIFRTIRGLRQRDLGRRVGISQSLISLMETEKIRPGNELKRKIASVLEEEEDLIFPED